LFTSYGLVYAITQPVSRALIADFSKDINGTAMGLYYFVTGIVTIPAGLLAGFLWDISPSTMFTYVTGIAFLSLILLGFMEDK